MRLGRATRFFVLLLVGSLIGCGAARAEVDPASLQMLLQRGGTIDLAGHTLEAGVLKRLYAPRDYRPIWTAERQSEFAAALTEAPSQGLDPQAFAPPHADPTATELLLTDAFLRYATALARGRVTMHDIEDDWAIPQPSIDPATLLDDVLRHGVTATLGALPPHNAAYQRLGQADLRYRAFTQHSAWGPIALKLPLRPGAEGSDIVTLRQRLAAEDLIPASDSPVFDSALAGAVKRFQAARGLLADGIVGPATLGALNVAPAARLRTIGLNLERWRAMPRDEPATRIVVNVPDATVTLDQEGQSPLTMRAVVGAPHHPTPVLQATVTSLLLNPPWIVPTTIAAREILPLARKNPGYLAANDFTFDHGRLVQRAGPKSALGRIKFELPNRFDVYLHDTPAKSALTRTRRALSHGCVRLEHPRMLAARVMMGDPEWTLAAIDAAIASGRTQRVMLPHPIPVILVYRTAWVDTDGTIEFRDDIYGRDRRLDEAFTSLRVAEQPPSPAPVVGCPVQG
jgi:murein L,D-transpeptidase YcbB/YkuD